MKKFISLLIASAMVVSLVPATAFAGSDVSATAKVVGADTITEDYGSTAITSTDVPELQITIADATYSGNDNADASTVEMEIEVTIDDAEFDTYDPANVTWEFDSDSIHYSTSPSTTSATGSSSASTVGSIKVVQTDDDELTITVIGKLTEGDKIIIPMTDLTPDLDAGDYATVSVDSDMVEADDLVFLSCEDTGIEASVDDIVYVAEDEGTTLDDLVIEELVDGTFANEQILVLELSNGFEFGNADNSITIGSTGNWIIKSSEFSDEYAYFQLASGADYIDEIELTGLYIYADDADEGDICTVEITLYDGDDFDDDVKSANKVAECEVEVAEVCEYTVTIEVDEDDDVPVFYNGTDSGNFGLNDDGDHESLEVTISESFPGAWSYRDEFSLTLPEGVYVIEMDVDTDNWTYTSDNSSIGEEAFQEAYADGGYEGFEFSKRLFNDTVDDEEIEITFTMVLTAAPDFVGDVELGFYVGDDEIGTVVIAEFVSAYEIEASQNDVIIDYRNTPIETPIVITEAEAELWSDDMIFYLDMEGSYIDFDDEGEATVNSDSEMEIDYDVTESDDESKLTIEIEAESEDEAAVITIEGIELYMNRSLAAGAYALDVDTFANEAFMKEVIFAASYDEDVWCVGSVVDGDDDFEEGGGYSVEVCENFVNIVTAGSDQATTFTTKVIVPVGESYIYSGGTQIELDVPAYISADGYTMLPVRAVATAIGVSTSNVLWDSATSQVTIIYGTKTIAMVIGQSYMTVNGTAIPTSACPEIVDGRTFLPLRDLATALSVTTIDWDADTRTASLN